MRTIKNQIAIYQSRELLQKGEKTFAFSNCVFVGMDENGEPRYASHRSINDSSQYILKTDLRNSDKSCGFKLLGNINAQTVTVCEAPIDAMSYASLAKLQERDLSDEHILSLGGVSDTALSRFLKSHDTVTTINIALDNDTPGRAAGEKLKSKYVKLGYTVLESYPISKDYNDELKALRQKESAPQVDLPPRDASSNQAITHFTQVKHLNKGLVLEMFESGQAYQSARQIELGEKTVTVTDTVFQRLDENGKQLYGISVSHSAADKAEFKVEYANKGQTECYLSKVGKSNTLLVFNNPVSALTYESVDMVRKNPHQHSHICCIANQDKAVEDFLKANPQIDTVQVVMDKAIGINSKSRQNFDYRQVAFERVKGCLQKSNPKIQLMQKYPKEATLNMDLQKSLMKKSLTNEAKQASENNPKADELICEK